jgi:hypothetical protein
MKSTAILLLCEHSAVGDTGITEYTNIQASTNTIQLLYFRRKEFFENLVPSSQLISPLLNDQESIANAVPEMFSSATAKQTTISTFSAISPVRKQH